MAAFLPGRRRYQVSSNGRPVEQCRLLRSPWAYFDSFPARFNVARMRHIGEIYGGVYELGRCFKPARKKSNKFNALALKLAPIAPTNYLFKQQGLPKNREAFCFYCFLCCVIQSVALLGRSLG